MNILTPDFGTYTTAHKLSAVALHDRFLELRWQDALTSRFHYIWFRDNCAAPQSVNPTTREQTYDISQAPEDVHPECADITAEGALRIVWAHDRQESLYHPGWLREHRYDSRSRARSDAVAWDGGFDVPRFSGAAVLREDDALHEWLLVQRASGLTILEGIPRESDEVLAVAERIAELLRQEQTQAFATLTTLPWDFHNRAKTSDYRWRAPIIAVNSAGEVTEIRIASFLRGPLSAPFEQVEQAYAAYRVLSDYIKEPRFRITFRLRPGDCMVFDNRRVLHARAGFDPSTGERRLCGCYVDRDDLESRIRILERQWTTAPQERRTTESVSE